MPLHLRRRVRRARTVLLVCIATLLVGVGLLAPTAADAHGRGHSNRGHSKSAAREATSTSPPQESAGEVPASSETPVGTEVPATTAPVEATAPTSREERREERRERRRRRHDGRLERSDAPSSGCSIELQATPSIITTAAPLSLTGMLSCPQTAGATGQSTAGQSVAGQTVTLYQKLGHMPGFNVAATTSTEANGAFQFDQASIEGDSDFYVSSDGTESAPTRVEIAPQVTLSTPAAGTQLFAGDDGRAARAGAASADSNAVTFTGTVSPVATGATVTLQREHGIERWSRIGGARVNAEGEYSITHTFFRPGVAHIRVLVRSHGLDLKSVSSPVTYEISRRRSSKVTIQASANPIAYGTPLTITGTVAGAADAPVTLLAQTGDGEFAPLQKGLTNGSGEYTFTVSPLLSTRYRVQSSSASSAAVSSAAFSESVTYALTTTAAPSTLQAGAQLAFTGTLSPLHEGQIVNLECLNASGVGYHVIASGIVSSTSAYSITHTFSAAGTELLRIGVPGSAELQSVASEPFKLEITPAA
jgi:hypothetical protein